MAAQQENASGYLTTPEDTAGLPKGIKYIIGNEAAERFSFYGMRTILVVFMTKYLHLMVDGEVGTKMSGAAANETYHNFVAATYFFPILGSLLSDVFVGKYRTILWLSIVYCIGHGALALMGGAGLSPAMWLFVGLFLISFGSGGIKPCVSAHVGDQFGPKNSHLMTKVFQWFYFAINFGSTASTAATPWLLKWYGPHVAFGIPGVLMALATILFWMGRNVFIHVPPGGNKFVKETFSKEGISALLKLSVIYAFVAVFWALFDQTGSSWVLQAQNMDRRFLGVNWLESQIQLVNPLLVLLLIPVFQMVIYPSVNKVFKLTPMRKMTIGFFLMVAAFAIVSMAQNLIDGGATPSIAWQLWAYVLLTASEIMISITGLEFSYTQAPKTMKSVIMAVWLFSVSLGNIFTSVVNNQIQTPGINQVAETVAKQDAGSEDSIGSWIFKTSERSLEETEKKGKTIQIQGIDGQYDTADDVTLSFNDFNQLKGVKTGDNEVLEQAADLIEKSFFDSNSTDGDQNLPSDEEAAKLLSDLKDSRGNALTYSLLSRDAFRLVTSGADETAQTQWDVVLNGNVSRPKKDDGEAAEDYTWLENRIIEIRGDEGKAEVEAARGNIAKTEISRDITVGGQDTLEGADYFWFWTYAILITAVLFIPVGYFYKEKSYIQTEDDAEPAVESGTE